MAAECEFVCICICGCLHVFAFAEYVFVHVLICRPNTPSLYTHTHSPHIQIPQLKPQAQHKSKHKDIYTPAQVGQPLVSRSVGGTVGGPAPALSHAPFSCQFPGVDPEVSYQPLHPNPANR